MDLSKVLREYGLSDKQAKIYLSCLSVGGGSAQKISKRAGLARSTTYEVLDALKGIGLISTYQKKSVKYYHAEDPHVVAALAKERADLIERALPNFMALYNNNSLKPSVRFYEGRSNLKVVFKEILAEAKHFMGFSSAEDLVKVLGAEYQDFLTKRIAKKIHTRIIMRDSPVAREMQRTGSPELRMVKLVPPSYLHHNLVLVWNRKVAILNIGKDFNVMIIEGEDVSQFFTSTFEFMWNLLPSV